MCHYSLGFAQQVHFPLDCQQTGSEYFKTAKKCGMCTNVQVNYLINEEENPGKGADCVTSLVHHYLENYGSGASDSSFKHIIVSDRTKTIVPCNTLSGTP